MKNNLYLPRYRVQSVILNGLFAGFRTVVQRSNYVAFRDRSIHVERARLQLENTQYKTKVFNLSRDFILIILSLFVYNHLYVYTTFYLCILHSICVYYILCEYTTF